MLTAKPRLSSRRRRRLASFVESGRSKWRPSETAARALAVLARAAAPPHPTAVYKAEVAGALGVSSRELRPSADDSTVVRAPERTPEGFRKIGAAWAFRA